MRPARLIAAAALLLAVQSCATTGYTPDATPSMPAARQALRSEFRLFHDALEDYGDWVLIEPYGYVFRPDVNFVAWRPYVEGFWAPSEIYGWIWVSEEPFGWATYHYGEWGYDRFQGWVWIPGLYWAPAWVEWQATDQFVGWAPLMPPSVDWNAIPGGPFVYVPTIQMSNTKLSGSVLSAAQVGTGIASENRVNNFVDRGGVTFNRGPSLADIERIAGPLPRVTLNDMVPVNLAPAGEGRTRERNDASGVRGAAPSPVQITRQAGAKAAQDARAVVRAGGSVPARVPVVRPLGAPDVTPKPARKLQNDPDRTRGAKKTKPAPADTTKQ